MQARHWPILVRVWSARCSDVIFLSVWTNASAIPQSSLTCQACSGGIGRNVLNLLSIYFTFFGKVGRAVAAWAFPGADHPTSSLSGGHRSDEAGGSRAHECSPRAEIRREFHALFETEKKRHLLEAKKKTLQPEARWRVNLCRARPCTQCSDLSRRHGWHGSGGARCLTIVIGLIPASYERWCTIVLQWRTYSMNHDY